MVVLCVAAPKVTLAANRRRGCCKVEAGSFRLRALAECSMASRIMIVEGEGVVALDIESILLTAGYQVVAMTFTGREAFQSAQETIPDLALIDIGLKGPIDGIEVAHALRQSLNLAIVFLIGHTDQQTRARAALARPLGYVTKPFQQAGLLSTIEFALQKIRNGKEDGVVGQMDAHLAEQQFARNSSNELP